MAFREKMAWVTAASTLFLWGYFFVRLVFALGAGEVDGDSFLGLFVACTVVFVIIQIVVAVALAIRSPSEANAPPDERDKLIELEATARGYAVLMFLVVLVALATPFLAAAGAHLFPADPIVGVLLVAGSGIWLAVVAAELVRTASQIVSYRRQA